MAHWLQMPKVSEIIFIILINFRKLTSARPPSALTGGTATRLTSAMHTSNPIVSNQRIGTAIGFANNVI